MNLDLSTYIIGLQGLDGSCIIKYLKNNKIKVPLEKTCHLVTLLVMFLITFSLHCTGFNERAFFP